MKTLSVERFCSRVDGNVDCMIVKSNSLRLLDKIHYGHGNNIIESGHQAPEFGWK